MIGDNIKRKRKQLNLTLEELAKKVGVSRQTIFRYETGQINIPSDKIEKIADALKCSPAYIMGWEKEDPTPNQRTSYEEMERLIEQAEQGNVGQHTLAYGGLLEEDEVTKTLNALEQLDSHSRDEYNILMELMNSKSGAVVFGYDAGEWKRETLTEKEAEVVFTLLHTLRK